MNDSVTQVEITNADIVVNAVLLGELLDIQPAEIPALMKSHAITSTCEKGVGEDSGEYRLSFFYRNRRLQLVVDEAGRILRRSVIDFGERPLPRSMHTVRPPLSR
jgi:hypothetical protein